MTTSTSTANPTLVFVAANLPDSEQLLTNISADTEVHYLDPNADGVTQIAEVLNGRSGIAAVHLLTHGSEGQLNLGTTILNSENSDGYAAELATIGAALKENGDFLIYGCNAAHGSAGLSFIQQLGKLLGKDVAASDDLTGTSALGGDWQLEVTTGIIEAATLSPTNYQYLLDTINGTSGNDNLDGTANDDTMFGLDGSDTLRGLSGNDTIDGGTGYDQIYGGLGNDILIGGLDTDTDGNYLQGEAGDDTITGTAGSDNIDGGYGSDQINGGDGNDYISDSESDSLLTTNIINAGAGDDNIRVYSYNANSVTTATGGSGKDTYEVLNYSNAKLVITDFVAGASGDVLNVQSLLGQSTGYSGGNPFHASLSYFRFLVDGADALLQWDKDGLAVGSTWKTVVTLKNFDATTLTAENFLPLIPPDGSSTGLTITGTDLGETLNGGVVNDTISGLAGNDLLYGFGGDDLLNGGAGYDELYGDVGNDTLIGGDTGETDSNYLIGGAGNDTLTGTAGNEYFEGGTGSDTLNAGDGNDNLSDQEYDSALTTNSINAGAGNDQISVFSYHIGSVTTVTGGTGQDTYFLQNSNGKLIITDFEVGASGDELNVEGLLTDSQGYTGGNPFAANLGYLRFVADGANTLLQWDNDGLATVYSWKTLAVLKNINPANLTAENFTPHIPMDGSTAGLNLIGTPSNDTLNGSVLNDTLQGLAGSDSLYGYSGNDQLNGGSDYDYLYGGLGNDILIGGAATDTTGDYLTGDAGNDTLTGTAGNDQLYGGYGSDVFTGGDGDDTLSDTEYDSALTTNTIDAGNGNDKILIFSYNADSVTKITGGLGVDSIEFQSSSRGKIVFTDFTTGVGGDILNINNLVSQSVGYSGNNPLEGGLGYFRLVQEGVDTLLQ